MTLRLEINIKGLDRIADAITALAGGTADKLAEGTQAAVEQASVPEAQAQEAARLPVPPAVAPAQPVVPTASPQVSAPAAVVPAVPVAPTAAVPTVPTAVPQTPTVPTGTAAAVPTVEKTYSQTDLSRAAITLADAGRMAELQALLQSFGVPSLPALPPEQYGAFATALRGLGARI